MLREEDAADDPLQQFRAWYGDARGAAALPDAMALATADARGAPSARMVLLKQADERGFLFFSNYDSRKGRELASNPRAALLFYWHELGRQVRIEGRVDETMREESDVYFASRPLPSRRSAAASPQSRVVASRAALEKLVAEVAPDPRCPERWGGYRLVPDTYEFWQHLDDRLHDRLRYRRENERWVVERLAP